MSRQKREHKARMTHPLTGERFRVSGATKAQLAARMAHVDQLRGELRIGMRSPDDVDRQLRRLQHGSVTVERAARSYMAGPIAENTRRRCSSWLAGPAAPIAALELDALDGPRCERWLTSPGMHKRAPTSVMTYWRVLRAVVLHAASRGWIARTPWGSWRPRVRAAAYAAGRETREAARSAGELVALFAAAGAIDARRASSRAQHLPDLQPKCAAVALLGLRQGELAGLRWDDVDARRFIVRVRSMKQGGPAKELRADPVLFELLTRWQFQLDARELFSLTGPVFPSAVFSTPGRPRPHAPRGECLPLDLLRAAVELAHLPRPERWSAQSLRDSFATLEAQGRAGDLEATRERTRHASIASLVRYLRSCSREAPAPGFTLAATAAESRQLPR
jgi:integrase